MNKDALRGRRLGEFILRDRMASGGFGWVYLADQPALKREAVVKILRPRGDPDAAARFMREAQLAARLDHPYAAHVYAYGAEDDGLLWIAMEIVRGATLAELVWAEKALPLQRFVPFFERLCEVVHHAHEQGIIHRDIKPANVMVIVRSGRMLPKLLDLGIAKLADGLAEDRDAAAGARRSGPASPVTPSDTVPVATVEGTILGTPRYMAPELWCGFPASRCTDVYALGVLAYQGLTGTTPFDGSSIEDLEAQHLHDGVPAVPPGLPRALDEVFARVLAKNPADRPQTALELAVALRAASRVSADQEILPRLDEEILDRWTHDGPGPLAEALMLVDMARNLEQLRDALLALLRTLVRFLGVLAFGARDRARHGVFDGATVALLTALRRSQLADGRWLELARRLSTPAEADGGSHPLPQLGVALAGVHEPNRLAMLIEDVEAQRNTIAEDSLREALVELMPLAGAELERFSFLLDLRLIIGQETGAVCWRGTRRLAAGPRALSFVEPGHAAVVDARGQPVAVMDPFAEVAQPAPGIAEALFLFAGRGRLGARFIAWPHGFERHHADRWGDIDAALLDAPADVIDPQPSLGAVPYRGLSAFKTADADEFLGRERETTQIVNRLRVERLIVVVGPSGVGKSSFVHAGVIPLLPDGWTTRSMRPGPAPLAALEVRLAEMGGGPRLLVIDQLEELFTLCADGRVRERFARAIDAALTDGIRVLATLRDDFLARVERLPGLRQRLASSLFLLGVPGADELLRIVIEPARRAGVEFSDEDLPREMVAAVVDQPGALALLSFTASRLWERRDRHRGLLTREAYVGLGGVGGALAQHAEQVLATMTPDEQPLVRAAFEHLVTLEGTRAVVTSEELETQLASPRAGAVLDRLIAARLLVTFLGDHGEERVEIVHEALLGAWPRIGRWRQGTVAVGRIRATLRQASRQWQEHGRPRGLLWRDELLAEYRLWRSHARVELTGIEEEFATASVADAARRRRARLLAIAGGFVALLIVVVVLLALNARAQRESAEAVRARRAEAVSAASAKRTVLSQYVEQGRVALLEGDHFRALAYLSEAYSRGVDTRAIRLMIARASQVLTKQLLVLEGQGEPLDSVAYAAAGARIITGGMGSVRVWDAASGRPLSTIAASDIAGFDVDPSGQMLVTYGAGGGALWETKSGSRLAVLAGEGAHRCVARLSPDGQSVVVGGNDGVARLFSAPGGVLLAHLLGHAGPINEVGFTPDGRTIFTASQDGTVRLWRAAGGHELANLPCGGAIVAATFGPDGRRVYAGAVDGAISIFDVETGRRIARQNAGPGAILHLDISLDGTRLLTTGEDSNVRLWDASTGAPSLTIGAGPALVQRARFSPGGNRIVVASRDRSVGVYDAQSGHLLSRLVGHTYGTRDAVFSPDGQRVTSVSRDGTARVWDPRADDVVMTLRTGAATYFTSFLPDGRIATSSEDATLRLFSASGALVATHPTYQPKGPFVIDTGFDARAVNVSADGSFAASTDGTTVRAWKLDTGEKLFELAGHEERVWSVAVSGDGRWIATTDRRRVRVWSAASGQLVRELAGHQDEVHWCNFSPDGRHLVTASADHTARIWDLESGKAMILVGHAYGVVSAMFSRDGRSIVTASEDASVGLWDSQHGLPVRFMYGHLGTVYHADISPDGAWIASASADGTVRLWDTATGNLLASFTLHGGPVWHVRFHPSRPWLATAGVDGVVRIWDIREEPRTPGEVARRVRCIVPLRVEDGRIIAAVPACP